MDKLLLETNSCTTKEDDDDISTKTLNTNQRTLYAKTINTNTTSSTNEEKNTNYIKDESTTKRIRLDEYAPPNIRYSDLGGIESVLQDIHEIIEYPILHPEIYTYLGVDPPRGVLLHGPPGCGKTLLAHAIAGELQVPFLKISAPEIISGMVGESEMHLRQIFQKALLVAPSIIFIDEIDAITPKRDDVQRLTEKRLVAQLLTCMDSLNTSYSKKDIINDSNSNTTQEGNDIINDNEISTNNISDADKVLQIEHKPVIVIGATNRPDSLDSALRRAGRFDREIMLGIPDEISRCYILQTLCRNMRIDPTINFNTLSKNLVGYVGADLNALTREAAVVAVNRVFKDLIADTDDIIDTKTTSSEATPIKMKTPTITMTDNIVPYEQKDRVKTSSQLRLYKQLQKEQLEPQCIIQDDFEKAIYKVQPSAQREGFATTPDIKWDDIGALEAIQEELDLYIVQPIVNPTLYKSLGLQIPSGVQLFGPPGCGKTLVAKAVANRSDASFLSIKGPELLNQYVGNSELAVRKVFQRARSSAPCIIFFDEQDALCPKRGGDSTNQVTERVVNQQLTELDGINQRQNVFVIAATNRPDIIDPAMLRPGRLDKLLYVSLPTSQERFDILKKHIRYTPLHNNVNLRDIAYHPLSEGFSGADIAGLVREATIQAQKEIIPKSNIRTLYDTTNITKDKVLVQMKHFQLAFQRIQPSVSKVNRMKYDRIRDKLCQVRGEIELSIPSKEVVANTTTN